MLKKKKLGVEYLRNKMVYTTKKYLRELKTNTYWEVEPHFYYWAFIKTITYLETAIKNKLSKDDFKSALYGEFDKQGKPILDGFLKNFNLTLRWLEKILTKQKGGLNSSQP